MLQIPDLPKNNSNLKWDTVIGLLIFSRFSSPPPLPQRYVRKYMQ